MTKTKQELTFKHNVQRGRHGWLRLTPAYSVQLVQQLLAQVPAASHVLDPFSGTGTTGLVAAENGLSSDLLEINPFLVWFAQAKTANYTAVQIEEAEQIARLLVKQAADLSHKDNFWVPAIHNIFRWWDEDRLKLLARLNHHLKTLLPDPSPSRDLLFVAFCRLVIEFSNAAFNHQSMSFKDSAAAQPVLFRVDETQALLSRFGELVKDTIAAARPAVPGRVRVLQADARRVPMPEKPYDCVITSPPYPNRMSYIRELRPYMYWLGYLQEAREAGELDWQAIGGTWGIATSRLQAWRPDQTQPDETALDLPAFAETLTHIAAHSQLLANYVHKYFVDMQLHFRSLYPALTPGAPVFYIVGNSKFYDTAVPVEQFYAQLLQSAGFVDVSIENLRKRNSKKELFEFVISGRKP